MWRHVCALLAAGAFLLLGAQARAVVADTEDSSTDTDTPAASYGIPYDNVGQVNGAGGTASGVYLGNGYVLTAGHVGIGDFITNGMAYGYNGATAVRFTNANGSVADLLMFQLTSFPAGLPSLRIASAATVAATNQFFLTGLGFYRGAGSAANPNQPANLGNGYSGFSLSSGVAKSYGTNNVTGFGNAGDSSGSTVDYFYSTFRSNTDASRTTLEAQVEPGDSGGGDFGYDAADGKYDLLIGINDALGYPASDINPPDTNSDAFYGEQSYFADLGRYASQIDPYLVPEPPTYLLLGAGSLVALGFYRRRLRAKARAK